jgi:predicted dehydrogenase
MQVGFQSRSRRNVRAAIDFLHGGKLGKVYMARGLCYKPRVNIGRIADGPQAEGSKPVPGGAGPYTASYLEKVHYDLWIGPGPQRPFNPNRFHYNWHWQWPYGNGDTGNQGPHQFDVGRWGLNKDEHPVRVRSFGGVYVWQDTQQETPNTQSSVIEYADGTIFEFETRGLLTNADGKQKIGVIFYGSDGRLEIGEGGEWQVYLGKNDELGPNSKNYEDAKDKGDAMNLAGAGDSGHFANFVSALKSGKQTDLNCDIEVGFRSTVLPHLCNISYRLDRELKWDGKKEQFVGDADANKLLHRQDRKGFQIPNLGGPKTA